MSKFDLKFVSVAPKAMEAMEQASHAALTACGTRAVEYAVNDTPVDTGLLRNSITYAISGSGPAISAYSSDDGSKSGTYGGSFRKDKSHINAYIGTNVEYAEYVENGTYQQSAKPFLRPAVADHADEYREIIKDILSNA